MTRRTSNPVPTSLKAAFDADKAHALRHRRLNVERLAELMGTTPATLYKWLETDTMPPAPCLPGSTSLAPTTLCATSPAARAMW